MDNVGMQMAECDEFVTAEWITAQFITNSKGGGMRQVVP